MGLMDKVFARVKGQGLRIVLPEGQDPRVIEAAQKAQAQGLGKITVLATDAEVAEHKAAGRDLSGFTVVDYTTSDFKQQLAELFHERRKARGVSLEQALKALNDRLYFGSLMVKAGLADGMVAGSIASTGDMLRAAFHCVGTAPGIKTASSVFIMELATPAPNGNEFLFYSDCGVNPEPNADQLSDIAMATASSYQAIAGETPVMAFLSFSTMGSAKHPLVDKVIEAKDMTVKRIEEAGLSEKVLIDGEFQADAALVPSVGSKKAPNSTVAGKANVLIFPDLQAGNISYKLTERLAGAQAYGPILQGLAAPLNDLSRGCSADDIVGVIAITACQAMG